MTALDSINEPSKQKNVGVSGPISWWSWRPGIRPRSALLLGIPFTLLGLLLAMLGVVTLIAGIEDSVAPPLQIQGTVIRHSAGTQFSAPQLIVALRRSGSIPAIASLGVSTTLFQRVVLKAPVIVSYSQHLHIAYALDYAGRHYPLPGTSAAGNPPGSLALLLLGLFLLPYPALLTHWGWQDLLIERYQRERSGHMEGRVVDKRATTRTRSSRPGFAGRGARPWYGLAVLPLVEESIQQVSTFSVSEEVWARIQDGMSVKIMYSSHLRYVYEVQRIEE